MRMHNDGKQQPTQRAEEVRIVVDVIPCMFGSVVAINEVRHAEQHGRNIYAWQNDEPHAGQRAEHNKAKNDRAYRARCAEAMIPAVVPVLVSGWYIAQN